VYAKARRRRSRSRVRDREAQLTEGRVSLVVTARERAELPADRSPAELEALGLGHVPATKAS
jgi:hypothetical protein